MQTLKATTMAFVLSLAFAAPSQAQQATSLSQSVERAVLSHPELGARFQDFQSSLEGQNVARGALLPEVNASGWLGRCGACTRYAVEEFS